MAKNKALSAAGAALAQRKWEKLKGQARTEATAAARAAIGELTEDQRRDRAKKAAAARWKNHKKADQKNS